MPRKNKRRERMSNAEARFWEDRKREEEAQDEASLRQSNRKRRDRDENQYQER